MKNEWKKYSLVDTNVIVYALDPSDEFKHEIANELFESLVSGKAKIAVSTQILSETLNVFTLAKMQQSDVDLEYVQSIVADIVSLERIPKLIVTPQAILEAATLHSKFNARYYDALIAATMLENGIDTIYTEDKAFEKIEGIKVVNPFEKRK